MSSFCKSSAKQNQSPTSGSEQDPQISHDFHSGNKHSFSDKSQLVEKGFMSYARIIVCMCLVCGIPCAMLISCPGIFYPVISADLGVQTAEISAWSSLLMLSCAICSPICGSLVVRHDVRLLMIISVVIATLMFVGFSNSTQPWMFWILGFIGGFPATILLSISTSILINRWFKRHIGLLMGICTAFTGIGGVVFLQVGQMVIDASGWRAGYLVYGLITLVACIPLVLFCIRAYPEQVGLLPYGSAWAAAQEKNSQVADVESGARAAGAEVGSQAAGSQATSVEPDSQAANVDPSSQAARAKLGAQATSVEVSIGMKSAVFWIVIACGFLINFVCQIAGYLPQYVNWVNEQAALGLASTAFVTGATLASAAQAGNAIGKIGLGFFSDLSIRKAICVLTGCGAFGIILVWAFPSTFLMPIGGVIFGFFIAGVLVLLPMMVRRIFGEGKNYPIFYGRISVAPTLGGATANIAWPYLADNMGGFDTVFALALACIVVVLITALLAYSMRDVLPREL